MNSILDHFLLVKLLILLILEGHYEVAEPYVGFLLLIQQSITIGKL